MFLYAINACGSRDLLWKAAAEAHQQRQRQRQSSPAYCLLCSCHPLHCSLFAMLRALPASFIAKHTEYVRSSRLIVAYLSFVSFIFSFWISAKFCRLQHVLLINDSIGVDSSIFLSVGYCFLSAIPCCQCRLA